jgi:putative methyltransferase
MEEYVEHPSQKPEILLERIVKVSSNESSVVLDLFAGSFSLGRVCKRLNRNYIGIEKSAEYSKLGNLRLK